MIRRIAHREHSLRDVHEFLRKQVILEEIGFDQVVARKIESDSRREITIAQPSGSLSGRTVHENVQGILLVSLHGRFVNFVDSSVVARERGARNIRIHILADVKIAHLAIAFFDDYLQVLERVGFERFEFVCARCQFVLHPSVERHAPFDSPVGQQFIPQENDFRRGADIEFSPDKACGVAFEFVDIVRKAFRVAADRVIRVFHPPGDQVLVVGLLQSDRLEQWRCGIGQPGIVIRGEFVKLTMSALVAEFGCLF